MKTYLHCPGAQSALTPAPTPCYDTMSDFKAKMEKNRFQRRGSLQRSPDPSLE